MDFFNYHGGELQCEQVPLSQIAKEYGTPCYVYSKQTILRHCERLKKAFASHPTLPCFAVKSNSNLSVLKTIFEQGFGADIVSVGELERALLAGVKPQEVVFSGVGKQKHEIERALEVGILSFNVESPWEIMWIEQAALALGCQARVCLRVNPNIDAKTNPYIATGLYETKFGLVENEALEAAKLVKSLKATSLIGLACHIGSQITEIGPFQEAIERMTQLALKCKADGHPIELVNLGGGLGITYTDETPPSMETYAETLLSLMAPTGLKLVIEPGRVVIGNAGVLLTEVVGVKQSPKKSFFIVDAAMNDLMRPSLYKSYHEIWPVKESAQGQGIEGDVVGPICETGDFLGLNRKFGKVESGDLMVIRTAGAYGATMSSNYNTRRRSAEVLVNEKEVKLVARRENLADLWKRELELL